MPEHTLALIEWTVVIWGGAFILGLLGYGAEALWIRIDEDRQ